MVRKFIFIAVFASLSQVLSATCLSSLRSEVLQKIEVLHATKVSDGSPFVARIEDSDFEKALDAVTALEQSIFKGVDLITAKNNRQSIAFWEYLLKQDLFLKGVDQLLDEKISTTLKTLSPEEAGAYFVNSVVYKLFFPDESVPAAILEVNFNDYVQDVAQFAEALAILDNNFYINSKNRTALDKKVREFFYSYSEFGDFKNKLPISKRQSSLPRNRSDLSLVTNAVRSIYLQIKYYTEPEPPSLVKYRPVEWLWDQYLARRKRRLAKENMEKALVNFRAFDIPMGKEKGQRLCYSMKAVEAFWRIYGPILTQEQSHYFKVQMSHMLPVIYTDFSIEPDILIVNGDYVTESTMKLLKTWSERLGIIVPEYKAGYATYQDYD